MLHLVYLILYVMVCCSGTKPSEDVGEAEAAEGGEEEKVMTLDEWKALEDSKRFKADFNIRKPGEGCNDPQWKKMFVLKKKEKEEEHDEDDEEVGGSRNPVFGPKGWWGKRSCVWTKLTAAAVMFAVRR